MKLRIKTALAAVLAASLAACGSGSTANTSTDNTSVVNIGATDTLGNALNPLNMDWTFININATSLEFLPLVQLNGTYGADYLLADHISTEDNLVYDVYIKEEAKWSDGEPVTADDVIFTFIKMASPEVANANFDFSVFKGFSDDGLSPAGAVEIEGIQKVSDKHVQFHLKYEMSLNTFINNTLSWILIIPQHVLKDVPDDQLLTTDFFSHPDVVSGPYKATEFDASHYISYVANENYFGGAPKIEKLNIRIVDGTELLPGLEGGSIDFILPSCANIPAQDRTRLESLSGYKVEYTDPITQQMTYFNTSTITDARVRRAFVEAIDRDFIVENLLKGKGENTDGFIPTGSPFYDEGIEKIPYDPADAKRLLDEAGWDYSRVITFYVSSSDANLVDAVQIVENNLNEVGIKLDVRTVDFATLMEVGGSEDVDVFSVQYTITPNDYYADLAGLINTPDYSWTGGYFNPAVDEMLWSTQTAATEEETKDLYQQIDRIVIEEVPLFALYFQSNIGVVRDNLKNAEASIYGALNNVHEWEFTE